MRLDLAQQSIDLAPGQPTGVDVRVQNTADEPFDVVLGVAGLDAAGGARPVARLGILAPGAVVTTTLQFALPTETAAGVRDVAIHVEGRRPHQPRGVPPDVGMVRQSSNLRLRVGSTAQLSLRLARTEVHGRFRGRIRADLQNQGAEPVTLRLWGEGEGVTVAFDRPELTLAPGHGARVKGTVHKPGFTWRLENRRAFVVTAQGASTPATTAGSYLQRGVLPRSMVRIVAIIAILGLWIGALVWVNHEVRKGASTHGRIALTGEPGAVIPGQPGAASGTGGGIAGGTNGTGGAGGTAGNGSGGSGSGGSGSGGSGSGSSGGASADGANTPAGTKVPVSMLGAVDGPSDKTGTQAILEVISLGKTTPDTAPAGKIAAFSSVRHAVVPLSPTQRTSTDDTGKFRFDDIVSTPGLFRLTVFRQGFDVSSQVVNIDGSKPNVELSVKLSPAAGALAGKVVDGNGTALGGATITVTASGTTVGAAQGDLHYETTSADGTGAWRLDGVATPATYVVRITKDSYASASLIATLDGGDTNLGLNATLKQGVGTVHALVRSGDVGVGALTVKLTSTTSSFSTTTRTEDPVGFFEIPGAPMGTYTLDISGDGWQTSDREVVVDRGDVDLGIISDLRSSTAKISGVVRQQVVSTNNSDGTTSTCVFPKTSTDPAIVLQPCGGVGIVASNGDKTYRTTSASGDGSFLLAGIPPGTYSMSFERAGYQTVLFTTTVAGGDVVDLPATDLILVPTNSNANASVRLFVASSANLVLTGITVQVVGQQATAQAVASTGSPDAIPVQILGLLPGTYNIRVTADEHDAGFVQVQIPLGGTVNAGTVSLTPLASVGGQVSGFQSRPVPGAVVFITPDPTDPNAATLLVAPRGAPANPDTAYLSADPAVGEVRLCARNVAAVGAPPDVRRGVCTRTNDLGRYDFTRLMRTGKYLAFAPENLVDDASSEIALDHTVRSFQVSTTVGQQANLDLPLVRFGAIVGTVRTPDPATGTDFQTVDGIEVSATLCQPSSGATGCAIPPTVPVYQAPRGRPSTGDNGTYRIDRLTPPGFDVTNNVTVTSYLVRFHKDGFVDVYLSTTAPNLNEERKLDAIMLPKPTRVELTPYWFKAGSTTPVPVPNATVTVAGIVDYTTEPLAPVSGSSTGPLNAGGVFDTNAVPCAPARPNVPVCTFKSGSVNITVTAPGFPTTSATVSVDPTSTAATTLQDVQFAPDLSTPDQTLLSARLFIDPLPQAINGSLAPRCCTTPVNGVGTPPPLSNGAATAVLASIQARLTVPGNPAVTLTTPVDPTGNYSFGAVAPGSWSLTFEVFGADPNLIRNHITMPVASAIELQPAASQNLGQKVAVLQKATVQGTIVDADNGRALVGASVTITALTAANGVGPLTTTTNGSGAFTLDIWDVPRSLSITVSAGDGRPSVTNAELLYTPGAVVTYSPALAGPRATLTGTVSGQDNPGVGPQPLQGVTVELRTPGAPTVALRPDGTPMSATSAADGTFALPQITASNVGVVYDLVYTRAGYDTIRSAVRAVTGSAALPPAVMAASTRSVTVTVVSATLSPTNTDVPLGGVSVTATLAGNSALTLQTNAAGQVVFTLRPGTWTFTTSGANAANTTFGRTVHQDGSATGVVGVGVGGVTVPSIRLAGPFSSATGNVSGRANPASTPVLVTNATVTLIGPDTVARTTSTDANGNWSISVPVEFAATTTFSVTASKSGYTTSTPINIQVPFSSPAVVAPIVLSAAPINVPVRVVGAESGAPPLGGVVVTATLRGSATVVRGNAASDAAGNVTLVLAPGIWDLVTSGGATATPTPHGDVTGVVTVAVDTAPAVTTLSMSVLSNVTGFVTGNPGGDIPNFPTQPVQGAIVTLTFADPVAPTPAVLTYAATTDATGRYSIFLPGGVLYRVTATAAGYNSYVGPTIAVPVSGSTTNNFSMFQQPLTVNGQVFTAGTGNVGVAGVKVTASTVVGTTTYSTSVNTLGDGSYQLNLAAGQTWTIGFDASQAGPNAQNVPVLYRYVGPATGGGAPIRLDHRLFASVVSLTVVVKGQLPGCTAPCATLHDPAVAATLNLTDSRQPAAPGNPPVASVAFPAVTTAPVGTVQTGVFPAVPADVTTLSLTATAPGYGDGSIANINLSTGSPCAPAATTARCVEIDLTALGRPVHATVTDDAGAALAGAVVGFVSGGTTVTCTTAADGQCTTTAVPPAFGTTNYAVTVDPAQGDTAHGQLKQTVEVPVGTGNFDVAISGVPVAPAPSAPAAAAVWAGDTATFTSTSAGTKPIGAQWEQSTNGTTWTNSGAATSLPGATVATVVTATRTITGATVAQNGTQYRVTMTNGGANGATASSRTSAAAALTVYADPTMTTQPASLTLADGATGAVTAAATGPAGFDGTAAWESSPDGTTWTAAGAGTTTTSNAGLASSSLTIGAAVVNDTQFRVTFSFAPTGVAAKAAPLSSVATLTRTPPPAPPAPAPNNRQAPTVPTDAATTTVAPVAATTTTTTTPAATSTTTTAPPASTTSTSSTSTTVAAGSPPG